MKDISKLSVSLNNWQKILFQKRLVKAQRNTAEKMHQDIKSLAPSNSGEYVSSIKIGDTKFENEKISTYIYTDLTSDNHAIGRMIEYGTGIYALQPHIGHTKTFIESQYQYWYVPATSVKRAIGPSIFINGKEFYIAYPQVAKPHFIPALFSNKQYYKEQIRKAVKLL